MHYVSKVPLIKVRNLNKQFRVRNKNLTAVNNFNVDIYEGETLGLIGESGCGKSTIGRSILKLYDDGITGEVFYKNKDIFKFSRGELKDLRRDMQLIFQDVYSSLNNRMTVKNIIAEPLLIHKYDPNKLNHKVDEVMQLTGLSLEYKNRFPHELSGGQRQRICIARALSISPKFLVCDETTSSLDVSIQAQVINLLVSLQKKFNYTYLYISHDLSIVKYISDRIMVLYSGSMVELADSTTLASNPLHPYTKWLFSSVFVQNDKYKHKNLILKGEISSFMNRGKGCAFKNRCIKSMDICFKQAPYWKEVENGHFTACHLY